MSIGSLGDYAVATPVPFKFTTVNASGVPTALSGSPAIVVYKDNSVTATTGGVTLTVSFNSVTGLNHVLIDTASDSTFYSSASSFDVVIATGTVNSLSVVGYVVGKFTIEKVAALRPTVAGRTFDVSAAGEGGVDWANVGSPTTTVGLTNTSILAVSSPVGVSSNFDKTGYALTQAAYDQAVNQVWATPVRVVTSVSSPVGVASNYDKGNYTMSTVGLQAIYPAVGTHFVNATWATAVRRLDATGATEIADSVLDRDMAAGVDSGSTTFRTLRQAVRFLRNKWSISGATLTVLKEDDSATSWTSTLATAVSANPITGSDPAGP